MTSAHLWLIILAVAAAAIAALILTWLRLSETSPGRRVWLIVLRCLGIGCLAITLANPIVSRSAVRETPARLVILADRSASMSVEDAPGGASRFDWLVGVLSPGGPLAGAASDADVRCFTFADDVGEAGLPPQSSPVGPATDVHSALQAAVRASPIGRPDAVVLIGDGAANRGPSREETVAWCKRTRVPIYCVGVGNRLRPPDAWLARVDAPRIVRAGSVAKIAVTVAARGLSGSTGNVTLSGGGLGDQAKQCALSSGRQRVEFTLRPTKAGIYRCRVSLREVPGEWTEANNTRTFFLRVTPGKSSLLVLAGRPGREFKFIRRALDTLADLRVTYLVRKSGAGFADVTRPSADRRLPAERELDGYDAIMLQDIPASALNGAELERIADFVDRRGGGLAVLGGAHSFGPGGYASTPLRAALGVRLDGDPGHSDVPVKAHRATDAGDIAPVSDIERHEDFPGWSSMPLLGSANAAGGTRPGASAPLRTDSGRPLLVIQRFGLGRTVCFLTGSSYRWVLSRDATDASRKGHAAFWRVLATWLTTPPNRAPVALETDRDVYEAGQTARVVVHVSDAGFRPVSSAQVVVDANREDGQARQVRLSETAGSPGRYEAGIPLTQAGTCRLRASAALRGSTLGEDTREIAVESPRLELADPAQDVVFLRSLADASGGAYIPAERVSELPRMLRLAPHRRTAWTHTAWARGVPALVILLALLGLDWFLRRWWGVG